MADRGGRVWEPEKISCKSRRKMRTYAGVQRIFFARKFRLFGRVRLANDCRADDVIT